MPQLRGSFPHLAAKQRAHGNLPALRRFLSPRVFPRSSWCRSEQRQDGATLAARDRCTSRSSAAPDPIAAASPPSCASGQRPTVSSDTDPLLCGGASCTRPDRDTVLNGCSGSVPRALLSSADPAATSTRSPTELSFCPGDGDLSACTGGSCPRRHAAGVSACVLGRGGSAIRPSCAVATEPPGLFATAARGGAAHIFHPAPREPPSARNSRKPQP